MNKTPYPQGYAHILDAVAGDQVPNDLDLAPNILARIQKGKGIRMQPRTKIISAILLAAIVFTILFFTVPGVAAAIQRWFGYVPGVGLVREGQIRVLAEPVSVTRDGMTVTVDQVVLDPERTALVYSVEGISRSFINHEVEKFCPYEVSLRVPDGSPDGVKLLASPNGVQAWASGYQHRFDYPPVPAAVNDVKLVISCLFQVRPDEAPENWEIPLHFVPATGQVTAFPVIEIPTATSTANTGVPAPASTTTPLAGSSSAVTETPAQSPEAAASPTPAPITLTLDRAVQMDDGYLIYAAIHWEDTSFNVVDIAEPEKTLHLLDSAGKEMLYEIRYDEQTRVDVDQRKTIFAIKTAPVQAPGALTLVLDSVSVELPAKASFVFDPGPDPRSGQTWDLNQKIEVGKYHLLVRNVTTDGSGLSFEMSSDNGLLNAGLFDPDHTLVSGGGGSGGGNPSDTFWSTFSYADALPQGPINITVGSIGIRHTQRLEAQWTPPAASTILLPTQPAACITRASWKSAKAQKPAIPAGLSGKVLFSSPPADSSNGVWSLVLSNLDGSNRQEFPGGGEGSLSPDGKRLAYSDHIKGIFIVDLAAGQTSPLPGTGNGDFNPVWSPDGSQIVFNRGMGIFDLFMVNLDGSNLRRLTNGGVQEWPAGWLPNGHFLYSVPGREYESTTYELDLQTGETKEYSTGGTEENSHAEIWATSPDGRYMITREVTFGDRWLIYVSQVDGSNRWLLAESGMWVLSPNWSPDGEWLLAGVSDTDSGSTTGALINLKTCQVISLPYIKGSILAWVP